eukprot:9070362-Alexandrium_andersonii.AAC.1
MAATREDWALWAHCAALCHQGGATAPAAPHGRMARPAARGEVSIPLQPRRFQEAHLFPSPGPVLRGRPSLSGPLGCHLPE